MSWTSALHQLEPLGLQVNLPGGVTEPPSSPRLLLPLLLLLCDRLRVVHPRDGVHVAADVAAEGAAAAAADAALWAASPPEEERVVPQFGAGADVDQRDGGARHEQEDL